MVYLYSFLMSVAAIVFFKYMQQRSMKKITKKEAAYSIFMAAANLCLVYIIKRLYPEINSLFMIKRLTLLALLWAAAPIDYMEYRIPNQCVIAGAGLWVVFEIIELATSADTFIAGIISELLIIAAILIVTFVCSLIMKGSIGEGDVKLLIVIGMFQGINSAAGTIMISLICMFIYAVIMLITHKKGRKDTLPYAPCALMGAYLSVIVTGI